MGVGYLTGQGGGGSNIKSIQRIYWDVPESTSTNSNYYTDFTINSVDKNKSVVTIESINHWNEPRRTIHTAKILNSTTVRLSRMFHWFGPGKYVITVVEFNNVKSRQDGTAQVSKSGINQTVNISNVNIEKSLIFATVNNSSDSTAVNPAIYKLIINNFINGTSFYFNTSSGGYTANVEWQVIEFN